MSLLHQWSVEAAVVACHKSGVATQIQEGLAETALYSRRQQHNSPARLVETCIPSKAPNTLKPSFQNTTLSQGDGHWEYHYATAHCGLGAIAINSYVCWRLKPAPGILARSAPVFKSPGSFSIPKMAAGRQQPWLQKHQGVARIVRVRCDC